MSKNEPQIMKKWKEEMTGKLRLVRPDLTTKQIEEYLDKKFQATFKDHKCVVHNNHRNQEAKSSLANIMDYIHDRKPIMAGHGVLYANHHDVYNPDAKMLSNLKKKRKVLKGEMLEFVKTKGKDSYEARQRNVGQTNVKALMNSYYGVNLMKASVFYNKYTGASVTGTGQALISTAETSFEQAFGNNAKFNDMDECVLFIYRVTKEADYPDLKLLPKIDNIYEETYNWIINSFKYEDKINHEMIKRILSNLSDVDLHKLYFKNNILAFFLYIPVVNKLAKKLINKTKSFIDPNKPPEEIKDDLKLLWEYCEEFVCHNYTIRNRIERDKYDKRKIIVAQDTDSTILTIYGIIQMFIDNLVAKKVAAESEEELDYIMVNIVSYLMKQWSVVFLERLACDCNIPDEYHEWLDLKNEFYYPLFIATNTKKRYITKMKLQEGKVINPPKIDVHGLDFAKAETSDKVKEFFDELIDKDIVNAEQINLAVVLRKLKWFENTIIESVENGETEYLPIKSVKDVGAYKDPWSEQGIKAVNAWNLLVPDMEIQLPEKILLVKLKTEKLKTLEAFKGKIPDKIYNAIIDKIFNNKEPLISRYGLAVIGIPQNIGKVPDWITTLADTDSIAHDNIAKFNPVLVSLGGVPMKTKSTVVRMSNVLNL